MKAIYTRVSTDRQSNDSQLWELREFCRRRGWQNAVEFCDQITGTRFDRAGLDKLMQGVRSGRIDTVIVAKLDRLARSLTGLALLLDELQRHRCALVVTGQGIDTSEDSPTARLQLAILGAVAAFERDLIAERTRAGLAAARANGKRLGRPGTLDQYRERVAALVALARKFHRRIKQRSGKCVQRLESIEPNENAPHRFFN